MQSEKFNQLNLKLLASIDYVLSAWLPGGKPQGREYVAASIHGGAGGSFSVNRDTGKWAEFNGGLRGGDLISLYAAQKGLSQGDAYKEICQSMGYKIESFKDKYGDNTKPRLSPAPKPPLMPPPDGAPKPVFHLKGLGEPTAVYDYRGPKGETYFYVARYEPEGGRKQFRPFSWDGSGRWVHRIWDSPRPLFGLELLSRFPETQVLVVEGEKACLAARKMLSDKLTVITWPGGAQAVDKIDWTPLQKRKVILWPDQDQPGREAIGKIARRLVELEAQVKIINVPQDLPEGWDAFDAHREGWDFDRFKTWAREHMNVVDPKEPLVAVQAVNPTYPVWVHYKVRKDNGHVTPKLTVQNVKALLEFLGITVRYDVIRKYIHTTIPGESYLQDTERNDKMTRIKSFANEYDLPSYNIETYVAFLAGQRPYNPVVEWVKSKPWDCQSRLADFFATVTVRDEETNPQAKLLKETLMKRWMVSAIASAFEPDGVSAGGVLVFVGDQYLGKTNWFKNLAPKELGIHKDGMSLVLGDKDSIKRCVSYWLVELGEIGATFRKSDIDQMKAFLTSSFDELRRPYGRDDERYPRRTVFFGSVNDDRYLHDATGNRRYWTLDCVGINHTHGLDMQQVWAEFHVLYEAGEPWRLNQDELSALNSHNEDFTSIDPIEEMLMQSFDFSGSTLGGRSYTATQLCEAIGVKNITRKEVNRVAALMRKLGISSTNPKGVRHYKMPRRRGDYAL